MLLSRWIGAVITVLATGFLAVDTITSCSPELCLIWTPSSNLTIEETERALSAVTRFNEFTGTARYQVGTGGCPIEKHTYPSEEGGTPSTLGTHKKWLRRIWISDTVTDGARFEALILHELGHAAGMSHLTPPYRGIMMMGEIELDWSWSDHNECEHAGVCK